MSSVFRYIFLSTNVNFGSVWTWHVLLSSHLDVLPQCCDVICQTFLDQSQTFDSGMVHEGFLYVCECTRIKLAFRHIFEYKTVMTLALVTGLLVHSIHLPSSAQFLNFAHLFHLYQSLFNQPSIQSSVKRNLILYTLCIYCLYTK